MYTAGRKIDTAVVPIVVTRDITRYVLLLYTHENGRRCAPKIIPKIMSAAPGQLLYAHIMITR